MKTADVVVIGGGVMGCACACYLARAGLDVVLLEQYEIGCAASGASAGGVRQQNRIVQELPLAIRAIGMWKTLEQDLGYDLEYRRGGHLTLIEQEELLPRLEASIERQRQRGLELRLVRGEELRELVPHVGPQVVAASYCPTDGFANPMLTTLAFVRAAEQAGARVHTGAKVSSIIREGSRVTGVDSSRGKILSRWVVNAAGAWSTDLSRAIGVDLPIRPRAPQMMATEKAPPMLVPVLGCLGRNLSLKQMPQGQFVIGGGWPGIPDLAGDRALVKAGSPTGSAGDFRAVFPPANGLNIVRVWSGMEAQCIDDMPILGPVDNLEGYVLATGFSGHGFALAPYIGILIKELITTGVTSHPLDELGYGRFRDMAPTRIQEYASDHSGGARPMKVDA